MAIRNELDKAGIIINEEQEKQLSELMSFLQEYSQKVNLTAIKDEEGIIEKHFIDSILPLTMTDVPRGTSCADIGTGAGFPALPMMIFRPDLEFTLVDSLAKRTAYLEQVTSHINAPAKEILHLRAEEMGRKPEYREQFGMVTARAVSSLNVLAEYCLPLVKQGGIFLAMRGATKEMNEHIASVFTRLGGTVERELEYSLPKGDKRILIVVRKTAPTPKMYPRSSAAMAKSAL